MGEGRSCTRKGIFCVENTAFSELECTYFLSLEKVRGRVMK